MTDEQKIDWFWAHRRNAGLLHMSFLMHGLAGKGWLPVVNFWFDNQIVVGVPKKGLYIFYDKNQLTSNGKYKDVQNSIDANPNFVGDFKQKSDEIFDTIFAVCRRIDTTDLPNATLNDLRVLHTAFLDAIMVAPIITVQLWGIEACFDENYKIMRFLRHRLQQLGKGRDFEMYKSTLSVNTGETVAFTEQKHFYEVASKLAENPDVRLLFEQSDASVISEKLKDCPENDLFEKHIRDYEWVNTEYVSGGWSRGKWIELFQKALHATQSPHEKLRELLGGFTQLNAERQKVIDELNPPQDVRHAIDALAILIAERDWSKGKFTKTLLSYHHLLDEIACRFNTSRSDLIWYSYLEMEAAFTDVKPLPKEEIEIRQTHGFVFTIKHGEFNLYSEPEQIRTVIAEEGISEPFEEVINVSEFKGLAASRGTCTGKARVIEDASKISELQEGEILVTYMTTIEFTPAFRKAGAVITDEGGMSCHAAIISREFKLPCIVGTKVATRVLQTGDTIEVDALNGIVKIIAIA